MRRQIRAGQWLLAAALLSVALLLGPLPTVQAYVGPGAGFAIVSSFLTFAATSFLTLFYLLSWPVRILVRLALGRRRAKSPVRQVVILGLDGLDPRLTARFMEEGRLPNFQRLSKEGTFARLATSCPSMSPTAWSSFATGVDASHHGIFDFITRDPRTYQPSLSSASIEAASTALRWRGYRFPLRKPIVKLLRKSRSFWSILAEHGVFCTVLRVPITFPPERFEGLLLSGMCVPDLKGSQGAFSFYCTRRDHGRSAEADRRYEVRIEGDTIRTRLYGPAHPFRPADEALSLPLVVRRDVERGLAHITLGDQRLALKSGAWSSWVPAVFRAGFGVKVRGICRLYLSSLAPEVELYVSPLHIDPDEPAMPISHPRRYSTYLSRLIGRYGTLGLAEDTSALNEGVLGEDAFLQGAYLLFEERRRMFLEALDRTSAGLCVCVFDTPDRLQHMFFRCLEPSHPSNRDRDWAQSEKVIEELYVRMDDLVGETLRRVDDRTVVFVISDHGFTSFRRGVNLNTWLFQSGYLALKDGKTTGGDWFEDVDWPATRAYSLGLAGIFINRKGREALGTVEDGAQLRELKRELAAALTDLPDGELGLTAVKRVIDTSSELRGPYAEEGPDLLICYSEGYRSSWDCAVGRTTARVFEDNTRPWSGDHCVDPALVPGVFLSNRRISADSPDIRDLAPTVLTLLGAPVPRYMQGRALIEIQPPAGGPAGPPVSGDEAGRLENVAQPSRLRSSRKAGLGGDASETLAPPPSGGPPVSGDEAGRLEKVAQPSRLRSSRKAGRGFRWTGLLALCVALMQCTRVVPEGPRPKVLILGLDGVDPGLLRRWMKEGKLPHLARLASGGSYAPLATSIPPESPVAWSNFATGLNPGGHGIFDFIHRDPANMALRLSTSVTQEGGPAIRLGHWRIPLTSGEVAASRRGAAFWEIAEQAGVPCTIVRIPANYPPSDCSARQLAGMGTPDMEGGYGSFSFYSDEPEGSYGRVSGGKVLHVTVVDNRVDARLLGPVNSLRTDSPQVGIDFRVFVDADNPVAEIEIQDHRILLRQGEWSDWTRLRFPLLPWIYDVSGICRFYLKEVRPDFKLYVSPINIDPADPALPISTPERYSRELAQVLGPFHTLGIPEDTKALSAGVFSPHEFLRQSTAVWEETLRLFEYELRRFREGLLLFYFGRADQLQHMFWRDLEAQTPARPDAGVSVIEGVYRDLDGVVGQALAACDSRTTLIVLSDHGFGPFRRAFNLNNWLESNGFLRRRQQHQEGYLQDVDWSGTRAYGLGFAGLYLNLQGRERWGATAPVDAERLLDEITNRLLALRDPASGEAVVAAVHRSRSVYSGDSACRGPDLVIGYNRGFRAAWEGVLGMFSPEVLSDNSDAWSGDHLGEASLLPGVLLINRRIQVPDPTLLDLAPTILAQFQIRPGPGMKGRVLFSPNAVH